MRLNEEQIEQTLAELEKAFRVGDVDVQTSVGAREVAPVHGNRAFEPYGKTITITVRIDGGAKSDI